MTKDEIIKLAREAGGSPYVHRSAPNEPAFAFGPEGLQAFALACYEAGRTAERAACADVCAGIATAPSNAILQTALKCAEAIRARGKP